MKSQITKLFTIVFALTLFFGLANSSYEWREEETLNVIKRTEPLQRDTDCENSSQQNNPFSLYIKKWIEDRDDDGIEDSFIYVASNIRTPQTPAPAFHASQISTRNQEGNQEKITKIQYYVPEDNMLYKINEDWSIWEIDNNTFRRSSRVFPYNVRVRGITVSPNKLVFEIPSEAANNKVGIIYDYRTKFAIGTSEWTSSYRYNAVTSPYWFQDGEGIWYVDMAANTKRIWSSIEEHPRCREFVLSRCWDWHRDKESDTFNFWDWLSTEQCDGTDGTTPGINHCNELCQLVQDTPDPACTEQISISPSTNLYVWETDDVTVECNTQWVTNLQIWRTPGTSTTYTTNNPHTYNNLAWGSHTFGCYNEDWLLTLPDGTTACEWDITVDYCGDNMIQETYEDCDGNNNDCTNGLNGTCTNDCQCEYDDPLSCSPDVDITPDPSQLWDHINITCHPNGFTTSYIAIVWDNWWIWSYPTTNNSITFDTSILDSAGTYTAYCMNWPNYDANTIDDDNCNEPFQTTVLPASCTISTNIDTVYLSWWEYYYNGTPLSQIQVSWTITGANTVTNNFGATIHLNTYGNNQWNYHYTQNPILLTYSISWNGLDGSTYSCTTTININTCGDNTLQPDYEQCDINRNVMPAPEDENNLISFLFPQVFAAQSSSHTIINAIRAPRTPVSAFGCDDSCNLVTPTCEITSNPETQGIAPQATTFSGITEDRSTFYQYFLYGNGENTLFSTIAALPISYFWFNSGIDTTYVTPGTYIYTAPITSTFGSHGRELLNPDYNLPTSFCTGEITIINGDDPQIIKLQAISGDVFTGNTIYVQPYDYLIYRLNFLNPSDTDQDLFIYDLLPLGYTYITGAIYSPIGVGLTTWTQNWQTRVKSDVFTLPANSSGYMIITWQITSWFEYNNTTYVNQAMLSGFGSNPVISIITWNAPILTWYKEVTQPGNFFSGNNVWFRIVLENLGDSRATGITITDVFPASLQFDGNMETYNLWTPQYERYINNNNPILPYAVIDIRDIDIAPHSSGYILLTGLLYDNICNSRTNIADVNGTTFTNNMILSATFQCGPVPAISKTQATTWAFTTQDLPVEIWDFITYRLAFANSWWQPTIGGVEIQDYLPQGVDYISSELFVFSGGFNIANTLGYTHTQGTQSGGIDFVIYSGFDLEGQQTGYLIITGQILENYSIFQYNNTGAIRFNNPYDETISNSVLAYRDILSFVDIQKDVIDSGLNIISANGNIPVFFTGDSISFQVVISNNGDTITNLSLEDYRPNCVTYTDRRSTDNIQSDGYLSRIAPDGLANGESITLYLSGLISSNSSCIGTFVNTGLVDYTFGEVELSGSDITIFEIRDIQLTFTKTTNNTEITQDGLITFYLNFANNGTSPIENLIITDIRPGTLTLRPSNDPTPFAYIGPATSTPNMTRPIQLTPEGALLTRTFPPNFILEPWMSGTIIITGQVTPMPEPDPNLFPPTPTPTPTNVSIGNKKPNDKIYNKTLDKPINNIK